MILSLILVVFLIFIVFKIYSLLYVFSDEFRAMSDTKLERIQSINRMSEKSPDYPNGWIPIMNSNQLKVNQIKPVIAFGYELVAFRGPSGESHIIDAFCPHLGAHFGIGAKVSQTKCGKDSIECPFHGWTFRASDGQCVGIPELESKEVESVKTTLKIWKSLEINDLIYVWYDSEDREPNWKPEVVPQIQNKTYVCLERIEYLINFHVQEIGENLYDLAHFEILHKTLFSPLKPMNKLQAFLQKKIYNVFQLKLISLGESQFYKAIFSIEATSSIWGYKLLPINITIELIGPGTIFTTYNISNIGISGILVKYACSVGPNKTKFVFANYCGTGLMSRFFAKVLFYFEVCNAERDMVIWNNRRYGKNPKFSKRDKLIARYNRWYSQFYSDIKV